MRHILKIEECNVFCFSSVVYLPKEVLKYFKPFHYYRLCTTCSVVENESRKSTNTGNLVYCFSVESYQRVFIVAARYIYTYTLLIHNYTKIRAFFSMRRSILYLWSISKFGGHIDEWRFTWQICFEENPEIIILNGDFLGKYASSKKSRNYYS